MCAARQRTAIASRTVLRVAHKVSRLLDEQGLAHALTGGLALAVHGLDRWTTTVEFVLACDARKVIEHLGPATTVSAPGKGIAVTVDGVDVALVSVEPPVRRSDLLCTARHARVPVLGLEALVAVKVGTASLADIRDVIELLELGYVSVGT